MHEVRAEFFSSDLTREQVISLNGRKTYFVIKRNELTNSALGYLKNLIELELRDMKFVDNNNLEELIKELPQLAKLDLRFTNIPQDQKTRLPDTFTKIKFQF